MFHCLCLSGYSGARGKAASDGESKAAREKAASDEEGVGGQSLTLLDVERATSGATFCYDFASYMCD